MEAAVARALGPIEMRLDQLQQQQRALSESLFKMRPPAKKKSAAVKAAAADPASALDPLTTGDIVYLKVQLGRHLPKD